jgi:hypothetical protein
MRFHLAAGTALVLTLSACGLDRWGEELLVEAGAPASQPSATSGLGAEPDADVVDATDQVFPGTPSAAGEAGLRSAAADAAAPVDAAMNAVVDGGSPSDAVSLSDGASDAGDPCARLAACCPNLIIPQATIPCLLVAVQDAGDSQCEMSLAQIADAGFCP